jgi:centriolar protein POC1
MKKALSIGAKSSTGAPNTGG